jgi:CRP-like cAMP-binding protein
MKLNQLTQQPSQIKQDQAEINDLTLKGIQSLNNANEMQSDSIQRLTNMVDRLADGLLSLSLRLEIIESVLSDAISDIEVDMDMSRLH